MRNTIEVPEDYKKIYEEFNEYKNLAEETIEDLNARNIELEKKLDALSNIIEVSKYINLNLSDNNLIPMINDMIIGILGVTYSAIYLYEKGNLVVKASNSNINFYDNYNEEILNQIKNEKAFMFNCRENILKNSHQNESIQSIIGVPITLRGRFMGYIILQHTLCDFFDFDQIKFVSSIANQISIAIENNFLYKKIRETSIKDPLLGIYNRRYFFGLMDDTIQSNPNKKFAIVMMDFDNFKKVNDLYGHQFGDEVLIKTSQLVSSLLDDSDVIARYGGEEIIIYIDNSNYYEEVYKKIDNIRKNICENYITFGDVTKSITASFGLGFYPDDGISLQSVISMADKMLYESKKLGKNRVTKREY